MSDQSPSNPSNGHGGVTFVAALLGFALFLLIVRYTWVDHQPPVILDVVHPPAMREKTLADQKADVAARQNSYGWIDQSKGVVRLPIDRSIELTKQELNAAQK